MTSNLIRAGQPHRIILEKNITRHGVHGKKQATSKSPTSHGLRNLHSYPKHAVMTNRPKSWNPSLSRLFVEILSCLFCGNSYCKKNGDSLVWTRDLWHLWALHSKLRKWFCATLLDSRQHKTLSSESPKVCSRRVPLLYVAHLTPLCNETGGNQCIIWRNFVDGGSIAFSLERTSKDHTWQGRRWVNSRIPSLYMQILWEMLHYKETLSF